LSSDFFVILFDIPKTYDQESGGLLLIKEGLLDN